MQTTTLQLSEQDALVFVKFQRHHALVMLLDSIGAFDLKSGSVTINFDATGRIGSVDKFQHFKASAMV